MSLCLRLSFAASLMFTPLSAMAEPVHRSMGFGHSNLWGRTPVDSVVPTTRYSSDVIWTRVPEAAPGHGDHMSHESHKALGLAAAGQIRAILE